MRLLLSLFFVSLASPLRAQERHDFSAPLMATTFRISLYAESKAEAEKAADTAFKHIAFLNTVFSDYEPNSELILLCNAANATPGIGVKAGPALFDLVSHALDIARKTDGAFDITCGNLSNLWRRAKRQKKLPPADRLQQALAATDWKAVKLDAAVQSIAFTRSGMLLDLGGIAKGHAADEGLRILREHGITRALVMAGGDIAIGDPPPGADAWEIKLRTFSKPVAAGEKEPMETVRLKNCGVSTSGDLHQFTEIDGKRYSHIVSPFTGVGLTERIACSVIAPDCTSSDALATAMCVLGQERGREVIAKSYPEVTVKFAAPK